MSDQHPDVHRIVVGVDGSEDGARALTYAARTALARDSELVIAHAVDDAVLAGAWGVIYDPTLLQQAGEAIVAEAEEQARGHGLPSERIHSDVVLGNPAGVLAKMSEQADLVVVGRRSVGGLERLFVGSTSVGVAGGSHCPVIMVSAATHLERTDTLKRIGVGLEPRPDGCKALDLAFVEAERRGAEVEVVHAWQPPTVGLFGRSVPSERLEELHQSDATAVAELVEKAHAAHPATPVTITEVVAHPVDTLVERSGEFDLLFLGVRGQRHGVGAVVRGVMAHSRCPLQLVRQG